MKRTSQRFRIVLALGGLLFGLTLGEGALRLQNRIVASRLGIPQGKNPLYRQTEEPQRYELAPNLRSYKDKIDTNSLGLRGPETGLPADGDYRILFVGDSATFAGEYPAQDTFVHKTAELLSEAEPYRNRPVITLNGGVPGYTPYNELHWLKSKGPRLAPQAIVIQFCPNDIVDPLPHWQGFLGKDFDNSMVPEDAIPDAAEHDRIVRWQPFRHLRLFTLLSAFRNRGAREIGGFPVYLSGEDSITIEAYSDPDSPSVRWLIEQYAQLITEARRYTNHVFVLIVPLAYQLETGYPHFGPQKAVKEIAASHRIPVIDLTSAYRAVGAARSFRLNDDPRFYDVWHLNKEGHEIAAQEIARAIEAAGQ